MRIDAHGQRSSALAVSQRLVASTPPGCVSRRLLSSAGIRAADAATLRLRRSQAGVVISLSTRAPKDMRGTSMSVEFTIFERLALPAGAPAVPGASSAALRAPSAPYAVKVLLSVRALCSPRVPCA